tara:strand:- start:2883 stop:3305 length:423 start_codon:yes stop_codon:yes gene_type:complete
MQLIEIKAYSDIDTALKDIDSGATQAVKQGLTYYVTTTTDKKATAAQRGSLHVWCEQVGQVLNDAGLPMMKKALFSDDMIEVDWNLLLVKEQIYKPMLLSLTGKTSTEKQTSVDPSKVAEHLVRYFSNKGVILPRWPSNK